MNLDKKVDSWLEKAKQSKHSYLWIAALIMTGYFIHAYIVSPMDENISLELHIPEQECE